MQRLVANSAPVDDGVGDVSNAFAPCDYLEDFLSEDNDVRQDVHAICRAFHDAGYIVDLVDAYYAWSEFSTAHSASWLIVYGRTVIENCKRFLIEDITPTTPVKRDSEIYEELP